MLTLYAAAKLSGRPRSTPMTPFEFQGGLYVVVAQLGARRPVVQKQIGKWLEYGEYITVEFDLDAGTATVCERE